MEKIGTWLVGVKNYEVIGMVLGKRWACWDAGSCRCAWYRETNKRVAVNASSGVTTYKLKKPFWAPSLAENREAFPFDNVKALVYFTFPMLLFFKTKISVPK
ncbi:hypothetical protein VIGAN_08145200 [Vigna angularis var. angularis]|uniref:Uncharacterized protein n=1 Tax=Vigna angularis var. angularis TaxID=157739 RepID=A0A0S3SPM6_PHAAN|nr:hypothetical protein VIGAN_08145200 [Vigna angularis var. angularis]